MLFRQTQCYWSTILLFQGQLRQKTLNRLSLEHKRIFTVEKCYRDIQNDMLRAIVESEILIFNTVQHS